jgi:large subunit ribosomal protein L10
MNRDQKAVLVEELVGQLKSAEAVFAVDYRGISVSDAADLRTRLRDADTVFRVVKNSLTERATDAAGAEALKPMLQGPTALAFVEGDAALAAKALSDVARALGTLEFKGGLLGGSPLTAEDVQKIARLPARDVLHAQLVGTIASPLTGLVRTLNALIAGLAVQLGQIAEQGLVSGEAPAAPAEEAEAEAPEAEAAAEPEAEAEVAPEPEPAAEPEAEAAPEPEAEAEAAPEPEPAAEPEAEAEPEPEAAPEAAAEPEAEAAPAEAAAEPEAEVAPEPQPEPTPEPEAEAASEPDPEAAAEPEAEAAPEADAAEEPEAAPEAEAEATPEPEAEAAPQEPEQPETDAPDADASEK